MFKNVWRIFIAINKQKCLQKHDNVIGSRLLVSSVEKKTPQAQNQ